MFKKIKNILFKNYSTDIALRYLPVVDLLRKYELKGSTLEVGSGDLGITPYLKREVVGIDIEFSNQGSQLLKKVKYDGNIIPYGDNEFNVLICVDALEHIKKDKRQEVIVEILRVAQKAIIIVAPCGKLANQHDKELSKYFYKIHKEQDRFLDEHINNGLPEINEVILMISQAAKTLNKKVAIEPPKKLLNLRIRHFIMKCKISRSYILSTVYYLFLLLLPIRKIFNFGNCYRQLFFIKIFR